MGKKKPTDIEGEMDRGDQIGGAVSATRSALHGATLREVTHEGPGKQLFEFPADGVSFSSLFDSGSMAHVERVSSDEFHVRIPEDASESGISTGYTTWFYFEVTVDGRRAASVSPEVESEEKETKKRPPSGVKTGGSRELTLTLTNMNNQRGLYSNGYTVMYCVMDAGSRPAEDTPDDVEMYFENERKWTRLPTPIDVQKYSQTVLKNAHASANNNVEDEKEDEAGGCANAAKDSAQHKTETKMRITFTHHVQFPQERVRFAFCFPYTYTKVQRHLASIDAKLRSITSAPGSGSIYYHRDILTHSLRGIPIELLTISSTDGILDQREQPIPGLYPTHTDRAYDFDVKKKRTVFVTARVHPGESPANFMLEGMLRLLLHGTDANAAALRRHFVFKIIPVLNPDGVCQGYYRTDTRGVNLNRVYENPQLSDEPAIFAAKSLVIQTVQRYKNDKDNVVYLDLHAHSNHRGCFVYGNSLVQENKATRKALDWTRQVQTQLFAKLASLHSPFFDYTACSFDAANMTRHDLRDNNNATTSRAGSSRVSLYRATDLTYVYTIECNYNEGRRRLEGSAKTAIRARNEPVATTTDHVQRHPPPLGGRLFVKYSPAEWIDVGIGCIISLLDLFQVAPSICDGLSPLAASPYRTLEGLRKNILSDLKADEILTNESSLQTRTKSQVSTRTVGAAKSAPLRITTQSSRPIASKY